MSKNKPKRKLLVSFLVAVGLLAIASALLPKPQMDLSSQYLTEIVKTHDLKVTVEANGEISSISSGSKKATLSVSEYDVANLNDGQKVTLSISALRKSTTGKVSSISDRASNATGVKTYSVSISLDSIPKHTRLGMSVSASITTSTIWNVLAIPTAAISESNGIQTVKILNNNQVVKKTVTTGQVAGSLVEITDGLSTGDKLVTGTNGSIPSIGGSGGFLPPQPGAVNP